MAHTDPIADLLTRIRNANRVRHDSIQMRHSKLKEQVARVMQDEGYLSTVDSLGEGATRQLVIKLKYSADGMPVICDAQRVSKPGCRVYLGYEKVKPIRNGLGIAVLSTPKGVMSDEAARQKKVGGEVLCQVW